MQGSTWLQIVPGQAWCFHDLFKSFLKGNLDTIRLFQAFFDQIVWLAIGTQIQQVYQLTWGVFCALIRSDNVKILACLDLFHVWI